MAETNSNNKPSLMSIIAFLLFAFALAWLARMAWGLAQKGWHAGGKTPSFLTELKNKLFPKGAPEIPEGEEKRAAWTRKLPSSTPSQLSSSQFATSSGIVSTPETPIEPASSRSSRSADASS
jgi:hypothetical protein